MDIHLLHVFYTTAQEGSISRAAHKLNFAQSNVTNKIQQLESDLKTQLLYRHNRGVTLTPSGTVLLSYAEKILYMAQEARQAVGDSSSPVGPLHIGAVEATAAVRLPHLLTEYHSRYPAVDLSLSTGYSSQHIQAVLHYELNGAFIVGPVNHPDLVQEDVNAEEMVFVTPVDHSPVRSIRDLQLQTWLVFQNECSYRAKLTQWMESEGNRPNRLMEFSSIETIVACISAGLGVSWMPRSIVAESERSGRIRCHPIRGRHGLTSTVFIRRKDTLITPALSAFMNEMKSHFGS